jgi:hypothetical protein
MTGRFPNDPDPGSSKWQITQIGVAFTDHARIVGEPKVGQKGLPRRFGWSALHLLRRENVMVHSGVNPPGTGSLQPVTIRAAVEAARLRVCEP